MPTVPQSELPIPKSWDEFEDIVADLYARAWDDPHTRRYGRTGQAQQGVDICGRPARLQGHYAGVQCKRRERGTLTLEAVEAEIARAEEFKPPLAEYTIATTARRDARLQEAVRLITQEREAAGKFSVHIAFWEDLCSLLAHPDNSDLLRKHYADWLGRLRELAGAEVAAYASSSPPGPETLPEGVTRRLKVFLCHASADKPAVRDLYRRLRSDGIAPWLAEEDLLPGQDWQLEIPKAVRSSDAVIICLSSSAITKAGFVQKEIKYALDVADEQPEGAIFLIPLRLEECEAPERLRRWQWVDLFQEPGYERLLRALRARAEHLGLGAHLWEPEMILIPAGEFLMGSDPERDRYASDDEQPQHTLYLPDYYIAKTPVTNAQYALFVQTTDYRLPRHWRRGKPPKGEEDHPVVYVSWYDAVGYCNWLSQATGKAYRLPSEAEWEKAARGTDGRIYPWGNEPPDEERCNFYKPLRRTTAVGHYSPQGDSPYGCADMAGNVTEWTRSLCGLWTGDKVELFGYPYDPGDGREDLEAGSLVARVMRGGAFDCGVRFVRCAVRNWNHPDLRGGNVGFRLVAVPVHL